MRTRLTTIILGMSLALSCSGCSVATESTESASPTMPPTPTATPTSPIRPQLPAEFIERIDGSTATIPLTTAALRLLRGTDAGLKHNATIEAYENVINASKDVIFVTAPSKEELEEAKEAGVELEVIPIVKDALVFLANTANPVRNLTQQQVKDIYSGKITKWNQVGGNDQPIIPYQRQINSGSQTLFLQLAMQETTPMDAPTNRRPTSMNDLVDAISEYNNSKNALGYSVYYYTQQMYVKDNAKLLQIDGIAPTNQTISDETYPYLTYYYAVIRSSEPANSYSRQLIDWLLCPEAQQLASGTGYVPLEASNIVEMREEYGYYGSTPQNTTESSGTGGSVGTRPAAISDPCPDSDFSDWIEDKVYSLKHSGCFVKPSNTSYRVSIPGYPQAEAAAQAWYDNLLKPPDIPYMTVTYSSKVTFDFIQFQREIKKSTTQAGQFDQVILRLKDGKRMSLADFFYDGVNYISFINQNLLNLQHNQSQSDCQVTFTPDGETCPAYAVIAPFTGLPSTYELFRYGQVLTRGEPCLLAFNFPISNPFISGTDGDGQPREAWVSLNLPADLSPYGLYWRFDRIKIGDTQVDHIVRGYAGTNSIDQIINDQLDALVPKYPKAASIIIAAFYAPRVIEVTAREMRSDTASIFTYRFNYDTDKLI